MLVSLRFEDFLRVVQKTHCLPEIYSNVICQKKTACIGVNDFWPMIYETYVKYVPQMISGCLEPPTTLLFYPANKSL